MFEMRRFMTIVDVFLSQCVEKVAISNYQTTQCFWENWRKEVCKVPSWLENRVPVKRMLIL